MKNGWTGGQYSVYRVFLGTYLTIHFLHLLPWGAELFSDRGMLPDATASPLLYLFPNVLALWDSPMAVTLLLGLGASLAVLFAAGRWDRLAGIGLWYVWACLLGRNPLIANPGIPYVGWLLLAHALLPAAPYGSWAARGRSDPGGGWRMPPGIFGVAWVLMAVGYSYSGYTKLVSPSWLNGAALAHVLENPLARPGPIRELMLALPDGLLRLLTWGSLGLELAFAPLALIRKVRPWLWTALLAMHLSLIAVIDFADLSLGMVVLHLFTFDPAWLRPRHAAGTERLFYDGSCGLCHRWVRFLLAEDPEGRSFRFAPLDGETFRGRVAERDRAGLPDSLVVETADGKLLTRSRAVLHILDRLGGLWRLAGMLGRRLPRALLDRSYDLVAAMRYRLFKRPDRACPILPPPLRARFDVD